MRTPLRWAFGDRAVWRGSPCEVEYVADDGVLISYRLEGVLRFAIVAPGELDLHLPNGKTVS
jgi:hypothetical protein